MKISLVTQNTSLVQYLRANPSLSVENSYTDLNAEYDKFINELNTVDVFLLIDYEDLTPSLAMLTKAIRSGSSYLFKPNELVLVTYNDPALSPTPNSADKYLAFTEMIQEKGMSLRLVTMEIIEFQGIYKAILRDTDWERDDLEELEKYKVRNTKKGIALKPKKRLSFLEPNTDHDPRESLIKQDIQTRDGVEGVTITIPERRVAAKNPNVSVGDLPKPRNNPELIIVTGDKYSGKTTACIRILNFMERNGKPALAVDTTGRGDMQRLLSLEDANFPVLKGRKVFEPFDEKVIGIQVFCTLYTAHFLENIKSIVGTSTPIFVEVDFANVKSFLNTFPGQAKVLVIQEYELTQLRNTSVTLGNDYPVYIIINSRSQIRMSDEDWSVMEEVVESYIHNSEGIYSLDDLSFVENILGVIR